MDGDWSVLAEPTFYIMMALFSGGKSRVEILDYIYNCSYGRVSIWPGMLNTILDWLLESKLVSESATEWHGYVYELTEHGYLAYEMEQQRMRACLDDALSALNAAMESAARSFEAG